jgi:hypothetical protein
VSLSHRPSVRLLIASTSLLALGAGTAGAAAGVGGADLGAVRGYAQAHGLQRDVSARVAAEKPISGATPTARCGPGSKPETGRQGRVPAADYANGRAAAGYSCNATKIASFGATGGYQVHRYLDRTGRECAFYDSTLLFPKDAGKGAAGVTVLDMTDPARPIRTAVLASAAMQSTHESLRLNHKRGLLAAGMGSPATQVGIVDVYDVSQDCRQPVLKSSTPLGILGHEGGFSPDGRTYWVTTTSQPGITAIDLTNPSVPSIVWRSESFQSHGLSLSADGNRAYLADTGSDGPSGMRILDVSQVQKRVPNPVVKSVGFLTWPEVSIPQNVLPVTIKGRKHVVEFDEFDSNPLSYDPKSTVGAARIIDISDERKPKVVSRIRLQVHEPAARLSDQQQDPQATNGLQGYSAHYCSVPREVEPGILACSMILSGLRVFDIRDPKAPREVGYFNEPLVTSANPRERGAYAMSAPAFVPERGEVWYTDGNTGFHNVKLSTRAWAPAGRYPAAQG